MALELTLEEVLNKAILKEIEAQQLYASLSQKAKNVSVKDALRDLANQERGHQILLEHYAQGELREGALRPNKVVDYKIAELLNVPAITPGMDLKEIFILSARREQAAHELYLNLAAAHPAGKVKDLLNDLSAQELAHKQRVETLYTEVAYPQLDGG